MKKINLIVCFVLISFFAAAQSAELVYKNNVNSTVTIETETGQGSGFFVGPNLIATNYHVIEGASEAFCYTNSSASKYEIEGYVAVDKDVDLVILKVKGLNKPAIKLANETPAPGQKVYVLGSPKGLPATITDGIVSGLRDWDGTKLIQISAPISHGSSGGPVLNANGLLVGIAVGAFEDGQNLNFAIPKLNLELLLSFKNLYATPLKIKANSTVIKKEDKVASIDVELKSVKIGNQVWSYENLNTNQFSNGDLIPEIRSAYDWAAAGLNHNPAYCYYENDPSNGVVFGKLYNWYAVADSRGLCPSGWHIPTDIEWTILENYLGAALAGSQMKELGVNHWNGPNDGVTNASGFTGLPGGYRNSNGNDKYIGSFGYWWTATQFSDDKAFDHYLYFDSNGVYKFKDNKSNGYSVRCIKD